MKGGGEGGLYIILLSFLVGGGGQEECRGSVEEPSGATIRAETGGRHPLVRRLWEAGP